MMSQVDALIND